MRVSVTAADCRNNKMMQKQQVCFNMTPVPHENKPCKDPISCSCSERVQNGIT